MEVIPFHLIVEAKLPQVKEVVKICIDQENFIAAQEIKVQINCIEHTMLKNGMDKAGVLLYLKFRDLEREIDLFILKQLRDEYNRTEPTNQTIQITEW